MIILFIFLVSFFAYYIGVFGYFIGGDDVWNILQAPQSLSDLKHQFTFLPAYRPIPNSFFAIYKYLNFNVATFHFINLLCFATVALLLFKYLTKIINVSNKVAFISVFVFGINHVMFYNVYTLSGISNLLLLAFLLLCLIFNYQLNSSKNKYFGVLTFASISLAILCKETSILVLPLIILQDYFFGKKLRIKNYIIFAVPIALYLFAKIIMFKATADAYTYVFNFSIFRENLTNIITWAFGYRHGWQMGMPYPVGYEYTFAVIANVIFTIVAMGYLFYRKRSTLYFALLWCCVATLPYLFLARTLVYYLDIMMIGVVIMIASYFDSLNYARSKIAVFLGVYFVAIQIFISQHILAQWVRHSFVANAAETMQNYHEVTRDLDPNIEMICIAYLNSDAAWAIKSGQAVKLYSRNIKDIILHSGKSPEDCMTKSAISLANDGRKFTKK